MTEAAQTKTLLYDATAEQRFTYEITDDDAKYEITQIYSGVPDDVLAEYDQLREVSLDSNGDKTDLLTDSTEADEFLFCTLCTDVLGFEGDKPDNWKELVEYDEKKIGISKLLGLKIVADNKEKPIKQRAWGKNTSGDSIELHSFFDGRIVTTKAIFSRKTPADVAAYAVIRNRVSLIDRGLDDQAIKIPASMKRKADLFNKIQSDGGVQIEGYIGEPPLHHKAAFITGFFESKISASEKK